MHCYTVNIQLLVLISYAEFFFLCAVFVGCWCPWCCGEDRVGFGVGGVAKEMCRPEDREREREIAGRTKHMLHRYMHVDCSVRVHN